MATILYITNMTHVRQWLVLVSLLKEIACRKGKDNMAYKCCMHVTCEMIKNRKCYLILLYLLRDMSQK